MHVIKKKTLRDFWERFPDAEQSLKAWHAEAKAVAWETPSEIKAKYRSASILKNSRVVFNICGNKYRLVVKFHYASGVRRGIAFIRFIGTHKDYDKVDAEII